MQSTKEEISALINTALSLENIVDYKCLHELLHKIVGFLGNVEQQDSDRRRDSVTSTGNTSASINNEGHIDYGQILETMEKKINMLEDNVKSLSVQFNTTSSDEENREVTGNSVSDSSSQLIPDGMKYLSDLLERHSRDILNIHNEVSQLKSLQAVNSSDPQTVKGSNSSSPKSARTPPNSIELAVVQELCQSLNCEPSLEQKVIDLENKFELFCAKIEIGNYLRQKLQEKLLECDVMSTYTISPLPRTPVQSLASPIEESMAKLQMPEFYHFDMDSTVENRLKELESKLEELETKNSLQSIEASLERKLNDLESKYTSLCDELAKTNALREELQEKLVVFESTVTNSEDSAKMLNDHKFAELDEKMMENFHRLKVLLADQILQLEWKMKTLQKMPEEQVVCDNAAGGKNKVLGDMSCISCNRYVTMRQREPHCLGAVLAEPLTRTSCQGKTNKKPYDAGKKGNEDRNAGGKDTIISANDKRALMKMRSEKTSNPNVVKLICVDTEKRPGKDVPLTILGKVTTRGVLP